MSPYDLIFVSIVKEYIVRLGCQVPIYGILLFPPPEPGAGGDNSFIVKKSAEARLLLDRPLDSS